MAISCPLTLTYTCQRRQARQLAGWLVPATLPVCQQGVAHTAGHACKGSQERHATRPGVVVVFLAIAIEPCHMSVT